MIFWIFEKRGSETLEKWAFADLKKQIKEAKEKDVSPMTIQMKYMKNYQSILKYRIEKQIDLDES